jgi:glycosyltransferase involved in cell wall biosynthesis
MKILFLVDVFFPDTIGGAGKVAYHLSSELGEKGHEIHVLTRNPGGTLRPHELKERNFHVHRFEVPAKETLKLFFIEIRASSISAREVRKRVSFDLICAQQSLPSLGPLLARDFRPVPFVYIFHSPWHEEYLVKKQSHLGVAQRTVGYVMKRLERRVLRRASKMFVLSDYMKGKLLTLHRIPEQRIGCLPGGVDLTRFRLPDGGKEKAREGLGLPSKKTLFLTVRNLVPRMGIETLIESFKRSEVLRQKAVLLIGGEGFLKDSLASSVKSGDLQDVVRFLGYVPEERLPLLYQGADFFVLPTKELEGFGLVILEAMACGTPVLGTHTGAIPETIGAFDKRLLFPGPDWGPMKQKLEEVIRRPGDYAFRPESCRRFVERNFSWEKMASAFEEEVGKLLRSEAAGP